MKFLIETSILVRLANTRDRHYSPALSAIRKLFGRGELLNVTAQNMIEFRNVATRPVNINGLGFSAAIVESKATIATIFERLFPLLPETPGIFPAWKALVQAAGVIGKRVHDARLVAVCHVHSVSHVLTFNTAHFASLAGFGPGIAVVHPNSV